MSEPRPTVTIVSPRGKLVVLAVICAVISAVGVVVIVVDPTEVVNIVVGVGVIGFFGIGGGFSIVSLWRRSAILRADDDGIRIAGTGLVPWGDIDRIGATKTHLGIRLRRYDAVIGVAREKTPESLKATRAASGGWDLTWAANLLDRSPAEAAAALSGRHP